MIVLSKKQVSQVIGGIAGTGDQGGPPYEDIQSSNSQNLPSKPPVTGG